MNGNVPILGQTGRASPVLTALVRQLDAIGSMPVQVVTMPDGSVGPRVERAQYFDADELLDAIEETVRRVVREELAGFRKTIEE